MISPIIVIENPVIANLPSINIRKRSVGDVIIVTTEDGARYDFTVIDPAVGTVNCLGDKHSVANVTVLFHCFRVGMGILVGTKFHHNLPLGRTATIAVQAPV